MRSFAYKVFVEVIDQLARPVFWLLHRPPIIK